MKHVQGHTHDVAEIFQRKQHNRGSKIESTHRGVINTKTSRKTSLTFVNALANTPKSHF